MVLDIIKPILEKVWSAFGARRRVRFTVHRAFLVSKSKECFFLNLSNLSRDRDIEITHVWLECGEQIPALHPDRLLPRRLKPDESWETWVEMESVPSRYHNTVYTRGRARLSSGRVIKSIENKNVPASGAVPGGSICSF